MNDDITGTTRGTGDRAAGEAAGHDADAALLTLTPDRSLLPDSPESFSQAALSREAAGLEQRGCWDAAAAYWEAATCQATGDNLAWCQARMAWCLRRVRETLSAAEQMLPLAKKGGATWG